MTTSIIIVILVLIGIGLYFLQKKSKERECCNQIKLYKSFAINYFFNHKQLLTLQEFLDMSNCSNFISSKNKDCKQTILMYTEVERDLIKWKNSVKALIYDIKNENFDRSRTLSAFQFFDFKKTTLGSIIYFFLRDYSKILNKSLNTHELEKFHQFYLSLISKPVFSKNSHKCKLSSDEKSFFFDFYFTPTIFEKFVTPKQLLFIESYSEYEKCKFIYQLLSSDDEILHLQYKVLAKKFHPDVCKNEVCLAKMQQINHLYEILLKKLDK